MPILVLGLTALMVFALIGILLASAMHAEHRDRNTTQHPPMA